MKLSPCVFLVCCLAATAGQRKSGNPLDNLPKGVEVLTVFGERADFSPDNRHIAFMAKSFGDAFTIDLQSRQIRCLTCNVPGAAFLRVMHLSTGDYLLIGPERFQDVRGSRRADNELWFLSRQPGSRPVKLGQKMSEGAAVSKRQLTISFSETSAQNPALKPGSSRLIVAELSIEGTNASIKEKSVVYESPDNKCTLEAQDFYDHDRRLTFTCYEPKDSSSVWTLDRLTRQVANQSAAIGHYNEVEGIFPDGKYTCVESDLQAHQNGWNGGFRNVDVWKLKLDGTGKDFTRITHFNDFEGWKASNPVVSTDGKYLAFQAAKSADEAGVGYGILLQRLK